MNQEERWILEEKYKGQECEAFLADCQRLTAGEPLAYIIGYVPFLNATIYLDSHPLIPRTETEFWVEKAINEMQIAPIANPKILDLCAGSGCIGVAVAKAVPSADIDFIEIDSVHNSTIYRTIVSNAIDLDRCRIITSDLFSELGKEKYDYILTNPPYIDSALDRTELSVKMHEPHIALYGGSRGLATIQKIIQDASAHLTPHGVLYIEHEPEQDSVIMSCAAKQNFAITAHKDQYDITRYSRLESL